VDDGASVSAVPRPVALQRLKAPAFWLVICILAAMAVLSFLNLDATWEPPYLNLVLQLPLVIGTSLLIAVLGLRSFLRSGSWPVLWLGVGSLIFGVATALGIITLQWVDVNFAIATNNLGGFLAAILYFFGAFFAFNSVSPREGDAERSGTALQVYLGSLAIVILITAAAFLGLLPPFFVQGQGGTPWRQLVVVAAGLLFLVAGGTLLLEYRRTKADFLYWYGLGLVLIAEVQIGILMLQATGSALSWLVRGAQMLGTVYLLVAALIMLRQARAAQLPAADVLASFFWRDEANAKLLFESIMDAIIVTDPSFVITDWNRAAEVTFGWKAKDVVGKSLLEVVPATYPEGGSREQALEALWGAGTWRGEILQRDRDGREIPILATVSALKDAAGRKVGIVSVNRDITERVQLERQLRQANTQIQGQAEYLRGAAVALEQRVAERTAELRQANESLQAMPARLVEVQENERRAISRELHDESGQLLTALSIHLGLLRDLWEQGESPLNAIDELKALANQLAEGLHRLAFDLRPASLDRDGLVAALKQYIESYRKTYGMQVNLLADGLDRDRLAPELESSLYRIIQEALTNVARHAQAGEVGVALNQREHVISVVIEDNGTGFDVQAAAAAGRLGLAGMQERAEMRGGTLTIESQPGSGTTVFVEIPCLPQLRVPSEAQQPETL
jgi:PAS domain S-box-containing protein